MKQDPATSVDEVYETSDVLSKSQAIKSLLESIDAKKYDEVHRILASGIVSVNSADEIGMTPLQQAAFKGDLQMCQLFIDHGAKINDFRHQHSYTALMFAALSGSMEVVKLLLENGADPSMENKINRTAAQLASFVGKPDIAAYIENFFSMEEVSKICRKIKIKDGMPFLREDLIRPLYNLSISVNLNPVFLSKQMSKCIGLADESERVLEVLELLVDDMMKRKATDEPAALRFHYIYTLIKNFKTFQKNKIEKVPETREAIEAWIKHLAHRRDSTGVLVAQECLARDTLRSFPYTDSRLLQQAVRSMMDKKIVPEGTVVSPLNVLQNAINGQRMKAEGNQCQTCGERGAKLCKVCQSVAYCDRQCQKLDWSFHKPSCQPPNPNPPSQPPNTNPNSSSQPPNPNLLTEPSTPETGGKVEFAQKQDEDGSG